MFRGVKSGHGSSRGPKVRSGTLLVITSGSPERLTFVNANSYPTMKTNATQSNRQMMHL